MAIIKKDGDLLVKPHGADEKVQRIIPVNVARDDLQPPGGRGQSKNLRNSGRQFKSYGVPSVR